MGFLELDDLTNLIELLEPLFVVELIADLGNGLIDWLTVLIERELLKFSNKRKRKVLARSGIPFHTSKDGCSDTVSKRCNLLVGEVLRVDHQVS